MTIKSRSALRHTKIRIDLSGPQGNAFCLLGMARNFCKQLSIDPNTVCHEMTNGDYENLIKVFDKHFGDYVTLYR